MEIVFRAGADVAPTTVPAGEAWLLPRDGDAVALTRLASHVLAAGFDGIAAAAAPLTQLVVPVSSTRPTLDDMLAVAILRRRAAGEAIPEGIEAFARYASFARQGSRPGAVPLETSVEGAYLAIRADAGEDLADDSVARRFLIGWDRLEKTIFNAAARGVDPFTTSPLPPGAEFAKESAFLRRDREVFATDVGAGRRYHVALPDGRTRGRALVLRQPKSLLFKHWSREASDANDGQAYVVLGVQWAAGKWIFSTDPAQRISLATLAEAFAAAETRAGGSGDDRWFDGAPFGHTLVAAPKAGSRIGDARILATFTRWAHARPIRSTAQKVLIGGAIFVVLNAVVAAAMAFLAVSTVGGSVIMRSEQEPDADVAMGPPLSGEQIEALRAEGIGRGGYAVLVAVGYPKGWCELPAAIPDASKLYCILRDQYGYRPENMRLVVDRPGEALDPATREPLPVAPYAPTRENVIQAIRELGDLSRATVAAEAAGQIEGRTPFVCYFAGHGDREEAAEVIGHLVLSDYDRKRRATTAIEMRELPSLVEARVAATHKLILADCCFAGIMVQPRNRGAADPSAIYAAWKRRAHVIITAAGATPDQLAVEMNGNSFLARLVIEGIGTESLADTNRDGVITDDELAGYVETNMPRLNAVSPRLRQKPVHFRCRDGDDWGQFLFIRPRAGSGG